MVSIPMAAYVSVSGEESTAGEEKGEERVEKVEDVEEEGGEEEEGKKGNGQSYSRPQDVLYS